MFPSCSLEINFAFSSHDTNKLKTVFEIFKCTLSYFSLDNQNILIRYYFPNSNNPIIKTNDCFSLHRIHFAISFLSSPSLARWRGFSHLDDTEYPSWLSLQRSLCSACSRPSLWFRRRDHQRPRPWVRGCSDLSPGEIEWSGSDQGRQHNKDTNLSQ